MLLPTWPWADSIRMFWGSQKIPYCSPDCVAFKFTDQASFTSARQETTWPSYKAGESFPSHSASPNITPGKLQCSKESHLVRLFLADMNTAWNRSYTVLFTGHSSSWWVFALHKCHLPEWRKYRMASFQNDSLLSFHVQNLLTLLSCKYFCDCHMSCTSFNACIDTKHLLRDHGAVQLIAISMSPYRPSSLQFRCLACCC